MIQAIHDYFERTPPDKIQGFVTAPTGAGKTVIFARLLEDLRLANQLPKTLIVVPTKQLRSQTAEELLACGFSGSVGGALPGRYRGNENVRVITYNAFGGLWNKPEWDTTGLQPQDFGLVIFDEAHHLQGEGAQLTLKTQFSHAKKFGFTATPDYDKKRLLSNILPDSVYEISTTEAIDEGLIAPYVSALLSTDIDMSAVRVNGREYDQADLDRTLNTDLRNHIIARFAADVLGGRRTQYNVGKIRHAEALAETLRKFGVRAAAVHGQLDPKVVDRILEAFHAGKIITALCQAQLLT